MKNDKKVESIFVFDCETIPDCEALRRVYGYEGSDYEVSKIALKNQLEKSGSEFLPVIFHKIVSISAVVADKKGGFLRVSTMQGNDEKDKIERFLHFINTYNPKLISFNGRGFDLPMIMIRAMIYNLSAKAYFEIENRELGKSKWENYKSRYDGKFHLDLLDHISDFRAVSGFGLDALCSVLEIPGKFDVHGSDVMELYYNQDYAKINEYCESDVLNTYWLFLKYELLKGNLESKDYYENLIKMSGFLRDNKSEASYTKVFSQAVEMELEKNGITLDRQLLY